jgi:serine/threonine-protein kinase HipA
MADGAVDVCVQIVGEDFLAGTLWTHQRRGAESATFVYEPAYLASKGAYALDPALPLVPGPVQTPLSQRIFGAFSDCSPESWGRELIERRDRAGTEGANDRPKAEADFLLGVRDDLRQGALRFRDPDTRAFIAAESEAVPRLLDLPEVLEISERVERDAATPDQLDRLLRAGGSLGGARPKAHVVGPNGRLAIAKFPRTEEDRQNFEAWEAVALELGRRAGLRVVESALHFVDGRSVLIVDRFDRVGEERVGYVSALTLLEAGEGEQRSYLDLVEVIEEQSDRVTADLQELWRRIAFSVLVSNTDDHLRNHGFLRLSSGGWSLSPAFDINPNPSPGPKRLSTSIDGRSREASLESLFGVAELFGLDDATLTKTIAKASAATDRWREVAAGLGLTQAEIDSMRPAFEHESAELAREVARLASA